IESDDDILWKPDIREKEEEIAARGLNFKNCELRSVVLVDRGLLGSDPAPTNYPGKIPAGLDLPSDVAKNMHQEKDVSN
ncbi:hypothetical protein Tsubulata_047039, partial [Turnera subulata]